MVYKTSNPPLKYGQPKTLKMPNSWRSPLGTCEYFSTARYDIFTYFSINNPDVFWHITVIAGEGDIYSGSYTDSPQESDKLLHIKKGLSVFVPAGTNAIYIKGKCSIILTTI